MHSDGPKLGRLITDGDRRRDAIHIAVAPVTAHETLHPGDHVRFVMSGDTEKVYRYVPGERFGGGPVGVVDPFLTEPVMPGRRFWLFLYPNTITGLRHVWTHPAFTAKVPNG